MLRLASTLASALLPGLAAQGCVLETVMKGELKHTKLDWQVPPLKSSDTLNGNKLWSYFQHPFSVKEEVFYSFWSGTLYDMHHQPHEVWSNGTYRNAVRHLRLSKSMSAYWFSYPEGAPGKPNDYAPIVFSVECAELYTLTGRVAEVIESPDSYYVITNEGREIGVKDGLPLIASEVWDYRASGTVAELLYQPRGAISNLCQYGVIDKVRCYLHENKSSFPEFEGIDTALQALRVMGAEELVLKALRTLKAAQSRVNHKKYRLDAALEVLTDWKLSDRQKVLFLKETLVPEVMGTGKFSKLVHPFHAEIPPALKSGKIFQIIEKIKNFTVEQELKHATKK